MSDTKMATKGVEIRILKGTYQGCKGWLNDAEAAKNTNQKRAYAYVIVADDEGDELVTRIKRTSFRMVEKATTYEAAALQQHPDMEKAMIDLARMFAECHIQGNDGALQLFNAELDIARENQRKLGHKARFRLVQWTQTKRKNSMKNSGGSKR